MASSAGATVHYLPVNLETKFRLAMRNLDAALDDQRTAIADMREAFASLGTMMNGLTQDFVDLNTAVGTTQQKVALARAEADKLVATAAFIEGFATA